MPNYALFMYIATHIYRSIVKRDQLSFLYALLPLLLYYIVVFYISYKQSFWEVFRITLSVC